MPYVTVFEITQKPFQWWSPAFGLIFVAVGAVFIWVGRKLASQQRMKVTGYFMLGFASLWVLLAFGSMYSEYRKYIGAYRSGDYDVVEGQVKNFRPMPYEGHEDECFTVRDQRFCYSDYVNQAGFNQSASHGGPIREGLPVRIAYYNGEILRLEIRADSQSLPEERSAYASKAEAKWDQWTKTDPGLDHMELGFSFAAFLMALCWNLDWRHYIRYWLRWQLPHMRYWELGLRVFFASCLVGATIYLAQEIVARPRTIRDYGQAGLDSLMWIGFFVVVDIYFRWRMRKAPPGDGPSTTANA